MSKFKAGDLVEVVYIPEGNFEFFSVGDVGIITDIREKHQIVLINFNDLSNKQIYGDGRWWSNFKHIKSKQ